MIYHTHTLTNGLRIVHAQNTSPVAYCGFAIDAGTRDEAEDEQGSEVSSSDPVGQNCDQRAIM